MKENLLEYRKKISELDEKEKKLRDLYLRKLSLGEIQGPQTGYASLDKPWLGNYVDSNVESSTNKTAYQSVLDNNFLYGNSDAIEYFGTIISYNSLFSKVNSVAKSLEEYGVKSGDFVTLCLTTIPETAYCFYAVSKIGAVANMISPFFNHDDLIKRISECESDTLIIMDKFYDIFKDTIRKSRIKHIVVVPTMNSSLLNPLFKTSKIEAKNGDVFWKKFIEDGKHRKDTQVASYFKKMPLSMVYSSGTTGASKGILLSNDSFQESVTRYLKSGVNIERGKKFYQTIPPWYSTGLSTSLHLPLSYGASVLMDPRYNKEIFAKNVFLHKPNYTIATTSMYDGLLEDKKNKNKDLSFFMYPFEGGEPLSQREADKINDFFVEHNCSSKIKVGYGQCECGATITSQTNNINHSGGSVGIPLPGVIVKIVNDLFEELPYGSRGNVVVSTPCRMIEYYKNPTETSKCLYTDGNNITWNNTGDIGYMDNCGELYIIGRASDYSVIKNKKVYHFDIERIISCVDGVNSCEVLSHKNNEGEDELIVNIVFDSQKRKSLQNPSDIYDEFSLIYKVLQNAGLDEDCLPHYYKIRNNFPLSQAGKRDIKSLKEEKDGFIYIDDESLKLVL